MTTLVLSLLSSDLSRTRAFYEVLGFCLAGGGEAGWMEMRREGATLQFYADPPMGALREPSLSGTIYLHVASVDEIAEMARTQGLKFEWGPETMEYAGVRHPRSQWLSLGVRCAWLSRSAERSQSQHG